MADSAIPERDGMSATAHHEAGHAVVGHELGCRLRRLWICLKTTKPKQTWLGSYDLANDHPPSPDLIRIALAGGLAEVKCLAAMHGDADPRFDLSPENGESLLTFVRNVVRNPDPIVLRDPFIPFIGGHMETVDLNAFADVCSVLDRAALQQQERDLPGLVSDTKRRLDQPRTWHHVRSVADALLKRTSSTVPDDLAGKHSGAKLSYYRQLTGSQFVEVIGQTGISPISPQRFP